MTTIAYRAGSLVGDGRETCIGEDETPFTTSDATVKVFRLKNGSLFGGAQGAEDIARLYTALEKKQALPKLEDINGLLIDKKGRIWLYEGNIWQRIKLPYFAIGSGAPFALAAMDAGATALKAVQIGIKRDPYSGGKITSVKLKKKSK